MAGPSDFNIREWMTLQFAPMWVFHLVSKADNEVNVGESMSVIEEMLKGAFTGQGELAGCVMDAISTDFDRIWQRFFSDKRKSIDGLAEVADVLEAKAGADAAPFKTSMVELGRKVAEAHGGLEAAEKKVLKQIAGALKA